MTNDVGTHRDADDWTTPPVRHAVEELLRRGLRREGQRRQAVHDHVHPQHLHGTQRGLVERERPDHGERDGHDVHRELELYELRDGVEDVPSPHDGLDDGGEVVVEEYDVARLLGRLGPGDSHGEAHVGGLEGRGVVRSVARDGDDLVVGEDAYAVLVVEPGAARLVEEGAALAHSPDQGQLVLGLTTGQDAQRGPQVVERRLIQDLVPRPVEQERLSEAVDRVLRLPVEHPPYHPRLGRVLSVDAIVELGARHGEPRLRRAVLVEVVPTEDATPPGDGHGGREGVAGAHPDVDPGLVALGDGAGDRRPERVLDAYYGDEREIRLQPRGVPVPSPVRHVLEVAVRQREGPQALVLAGGDHVRECLFVLVLQRLGFYDALGGDVRRERRAGGDHLRRRALAVQAVPSGVRERGGGGGRGRLLDPPHDPRHALPLRRERDRMHAPVQHRRSLLERTPEGLGVAPQLPRQLDQRAVGRVADVHRRPRPPVDSHRRRGGHVQQYRLAEQPRLGPVRLEGR
mmetsp:Transcript_48475/g.103101  ORF Transcript_48475/g.103101 Transcript_48475/m.103101 type:complete len:516 (-) Transcript_48475:823-2370(-)